MVHYEDRLPLSWIMERPDSDLDRHHLESTNLSILNGVAAVEELPIERLKEEQPELHQELARLDAKLHLVLDMVARLLEREEARPESRLVRLSVDAMDFADPEHEFEVGQRGTLRLHLHPAIPAPLALPGAIEEDCEHDGKRWLRFKPDTMPQPLRDALSRHIFRHHRRMVAAARRND
ncbi:PilZ domain-containing protein [Wenzhouxiangella sp. AB-CW3]|uniref:PilZ domain-containing protein n=1 Tax=Wenzhouxiangella sp. AB-CW3 TaxID=2771012 RepID=UPI00168B5481|nr:PilZ domain-containing protein [Wenzhouxiangella sp. AB-CW3]QOC21211.1 PilZ domain-containing protein [Wenzhouxiangella sp. AB-CW3]